MTTPLVLSTAVRFKSKQNALGNKGNKFTYLNNPIKTQNRLLLLSFSKHLVPIAMSTGFLSLFYLLYSFPEILAIVFKNITRRTKQIYRNQNTQIFHSYINQNHPLSSEMHKSPSAAHDGKEVFNSISFKCKYYHHTQKACLCMSFSPAVINYRQCK